MIALTWRGGMTCVMNDDDDDAYGEVDLQRAQWDRHEM